LAAAACDQKPGPLKSFELAAWRWGILQKPFVHDVEFDMKATNTFRSIASLMLVVCLLALPVSAIGKPGSRKGHEHFDRGMKSEQAQQWEKAAQEFTLAVAADPSNMEYQLHYRRSLFYASQTFMQQGRSLADQHDYVGAYNAFRQAYGYDAVNQVAAAEMEQMLRLQAAKEGIPVAPGPGGDGMTPDGQTESGATSSTGKPQEPSTRTEPVRVVNFNGDLKGFIRTLASELNLNVMFDKTSFAQPRNIDINLRDVTTARALDYIFLQEGLFFQKLDRNTILVADQSRRAQYQQLVMRTFYLANMKPVDAQKFIQQALPASVGRPTTTIVIDEGTNSITVRDTAENVGVISDLLRSIDKDRSEVVMDVNIYEISKDDMIQIGNQIGTNANGPFNLGGSPGLSVLTGNGVLNSATRGVLLSALTGGVPTATAAALVIPSSVLTAFQSRTNGRVLASTQIHAFTGEESTARIGERVPVQTAQAYPFGVQTGAPNTTTGNAFPTGGFPVINYEPIGLTLKFTPTVFPNLDVQVKMDIESKDVLGATTLTPTFTERTITGTARVQNNRTMLLASVSQDTQSNGREGLPVLSGLPLLGRLFTSPTKSNHQVDIVIAVTPRVLRAPAVTPQDELMRPSGTTMSPTTGSLAEMLRENDREDQMAAAAAARVAARRIPRNVDVVVDLPDGPPTYVPAPKALIPGQAAATERASNAGSRGASTLPAAQTVSFTQSKDPASRPGKLVAKEGEVATGPSADSSMPGPKQVTAAAIGELPQPRTIDVSTALKRIVAPEVATSTVAQTKQDVDVASAVERLEPKSAAVTSANAGPTASIAELSLVVGKGEMSVGEKRQIMVQLNSDVPLGLAVVTLRFDPGVIKVNSISAGSAFANAKTPPGIAQSIDQNGVVLVSIAPGAGAIPITGEGALLNLEIEAVGTGDSALAFDLQNTHLVATGGRGVVLSIEPCRLMVKK
jgi:general secretion pathway protein D